MLAELTIHNLVIVEQACLRPGGGLVVISGETGAGKSLLLDAIDLVSGARVRPGLVGRWGDEAAVSAVFHVAPELAGKVAVQAQVPVAEGEVILRRRVTGAGRSQAWINDTPVTAAALRTAADLLIDLHTQHEPIRLADPQVQIGLLDAHAGHLDPAHLALVAAYRAAHEQVVALGRELVAIDGGERESVKEMDYLAFQLKAFETLTPVAGEVAALEQRHALLSSAGAWRDHAAYAAELISDSDQALVTVVGRLLRRIDGAPDTRLAAAAEALRQAQEQLRDAGAHCQEAAEAIAADPGELARVEERLDRWNDLLRKHGPDEAAVLAAWQDIAGRLAALSGLGERRAALVAGLAQATATRQERGAKLTAARTAAFARLAESVHEHLAELGMPRARIQLATLSQGEPTPLGLVRQELRVVTNPGQEPGSIREIASGGEAARLMLALSAALAAGDDLPLMVFDEVDSGVGGRLGSVIGAKLARLASGRTVLVVTHTPQVAAYGQRQYVVRKHQGEAQTVVQVELLADDARAQELADMLGGGAAARAQADELLAAAVGAGQGPVLAERVNGDKPVAGKPVRAGRGTRDARQ